jgi:hypothetical protein
MNPLITGLDHVLVHSRDFDSDRESYALMLGAPADAHGDSTGQRRAIYTAGNSRLVLEENPGREGLSVLCFSTADGARMRRRLQRLGLVGNGSETSEGTLWLPPDASRGLQIGIVDRPTSETRACDGPVAGLDHAVVASGRAEDTAFLLGSQLGLDLRMDLSRADWDARLLFFRCGDLIIEVFERLSENAPDARGDALFGLSWRVRNADEARASLDRGGFDVSEVRKGRKPGTRVFTVRNRCAGVATLMLEPPGTS